jgi:antitoxin VapB
MNSSVTRVFKNGNSQAIRIPAEFRLNTDRVRISKNAQGDLIIHPLEINRGAALLAAFSDVDEQFVAELERNQHQQLPMQDRDVL